MVTLAAGIGEHALLFSLQAAGNPSSRPLAFRLGERMPVCQAGGERLLAQFHPLSRGMSQDDWRELKTSAEASSRFYTSGHSVISLIFRAAMLDSWQRHWAESPVDWT
jgi:hypothetical protein